VRFGGHFASVWRSGQHRDGKRSGHLQNLIFLRRAVAKIINNDGQLTGLSSAAEQKGAEQQNAFG